MKISITNLSIIETVTCRTPALSITAKLKQSWDTLRELIRESSPEFFELVKDRDVDQLDIVNNKIDYSLWKYFNRARFRATPFGSFGAISWVPVGVGSSLVVDKELQAHKFINWPEKNVVAGNITRVTKQSARFLANSTWYSIGSTIRYLRYSSGRFELASVTPQAEVLTLLRACSVPLTREEIYALMALRFMLCPRAVDTLLLQMVTAQLLMGDRLPNITGVDYFRRIGAETEGNPLPYIIAERNIHRGSFDASRLSNIGDYLQFMNSFLSKPPESNLDSFRQAFTRKFDTMAIPLALAIDPEVGVGYSNMARSAHHKDTIDVLEKLRKPSGRDRVYQQTPQFRFLLDGLIKGDTIYLEKYQGLDRELSLHLPNTLSVVLHFSQGRPVIEQAGGCTANALLGRFTLTQSVAKAEGEKIACIEKNANPGITFFDIAYQAEDKIDNINRRASLYAAELPILTWSCSQEPLYLDDILVAIRNGEVVLWSKKRQQRIIPRIASAYNYTRSDLALYRFLCDLQHQHLRADLNFHWTEIFAGLDHYPQVVFKNLIIAPAMWKVPDKRPYNMESWLTEKCINFTFSCGSGDQLLYFDPALPADTAAFNRYCDQKKGTELYITKNQRDIDDGICDQSGKRYAAQYIINYYHQFAIYTPYELPPQQELAGNACFPGNEWVYFELYCHPSRSNQLLVTFIAPFTATHKTRIEKWFFIRYPEPSPHIRLRLKLKNISDSGMLISELNTLLDPLLKSGLMSDIQIKTYFREMERYSVQQMDMVENFFFQDSLLVLKRLSIKNMEKLLYRSTLSTMDMLCKQVLPDDTERQGFIHNLADAFSREFSFNHDDYKRINNSFNQLEEENLKIFPGRSYFKTLNQIMTSRGDRMGKEKLLADMLHMHINRVFDSEQRLHEAVLYQYLLKQMKVRRAAPEPTRETTHHHPHN